MKILEWPAAAWRRGELILVRREHPLVKEFDQAPLPGELVRLAEEVCLEKTAAERLKEIFRVIGCGKQILPVSGYRSLQEQRRIYQDSLKDHGSEYTKQFVALPGASEHQTGLAIDLGENKPPIDFICPSFPYEGICQEFRRRAPDFGFIERYQKGKEEIPGIAWEPWHFRYVGFPHSRIMAEYGLTLEEYLTRLRRYSLEKPLGYKERDGREYEISYLTAAEAAAGDGAWGKEAACDLEQAWEEKSKPEGKPVPKERESSGNILSRPKKEPKRPGLLPGAPGLFRLALPAGWKAAVSGDNCGGFVITIKKMRGA